MKKLNRDGIKYSLRLEALDKFWVNDITFEQFKDEIKEIDKKYPKGTY